MPKHVSPSATCLLLHWRAGVEFQAKNIEKPSSGKLSAKLGEDLGSSGKLGEIQTSTGMLGDLGMRTLRHSSSDTQLHVCDRLKMLVFLL